MPDAGRMLCLPLHPSWMVYNRLPAGHLLCWPSTSCLPISTQPYHHNHWVLYKQNTP